MKELLASLKDSGHKLAVATMSSRVVAESVLGYHGIASYFDSVLAIDDVYQGKPDPEILQKTVDCLGGQVGNAIYAGDSSHDLEAAINLGIPFVLVDSGLYVRGEARSNLRAAATENGCPVVGMEELMDLAEIVRRPSRRTFSQHMESQESEPPIFTNHISRTINRRIAQKRRDPW